MRKKTHCYYCGEPLTQKFMEGKMRPFCERCGEPIYENPIPATSLIVINNQNALLLVKRSVEPKQGLWCLPGGFIELGEAPAESALRELKEETGLTGRIDCLLGVTSDYSERYDTILMIGYLVKDFSGDLKAGDDASEVSYFRSENLPEIAFDSHRRFIWQYYQMG